MNQYLSIPNMIELSEFQSFDRGEGFLCAMVSEVLEKKSQKGSFYCKITIKDRFSSLSFFLFGDEYIKFAKYLQHGVRLFIAFRKVDDFFNKGEKTIKILDIDLMRDVNIERKILVKNFNESDSDFTEFKNFVEDYGLQNVYHIECK